jgi:phage-related minor tail protein
MAGEITIQWSHISITSVIAFLIGWWLFGLLGAVVLAIIVLVLMGIIRVK